MSLDFSRKIRKMVGKQTSSGGGTLPVTSGLQLHLTANNYNPSNGTWTDVSPNARHFVQATSTARPALTPGGHNGLAVVTFDGGDWFGSTTPNDFAFLNRANENTTFVVARAPANSSPVWLLTTLFSGGAGDTGFLIGYGYGATIGIVTTWNGTGNIPYYLTGVGTAPSRGSANLLMGANRGNGEGGFVYVTGYNASGGVTPEVNQPVHSGAGSYSTASTIANMRIGILGNGTEAVPNGTWIGEIIIYNRLLNATERADVRQYLRNKWGSDL